MVCAANVPSTESVGITPVRSEWVNAIVSSLSEDISSLYKACEQRLFAEPGLTESARVLFENEGELLVGELELDHLGLELFEVKRLSRVELLCLPD